MNAKRSSFLMPGLSLLLLVFVSLCLITFSLLSLSGSTADQALNQKAVDHLTAYYEASSAASLILGELDAEFTEALLASESAPDPKQTYLSAALTGITSHSDRYTCSGNLLSFSVPVDENQILKVTLCIEYPEALSDPLYSIVEWKTFSISEWNPDMHQSVFLSEL